jgi:hypothetical protein
MYISIFIYNDNFLARDWNFGWSEIVERLPGLDHQIPILVDSSRGHPYIQLLFFLRYDPARYQRENFEVDNQNYYLELGRNEAKRIGEITVRNFKWGVDTDEIEQYIIADNLAISDEILVSQNDQD